VSGRDRPYASASRSHSAAYVLSSQRAALWLQGADAGAEKAGAQSLWGQSPVLLLPADALSPAKSVHGDRLFGDASFNDTGLQDVSVGSSLGVPPVPPACLMGTLGEECMLLSQPETPGTLGVDQKRGDIPPS
jgi:hypothetical protein